MKGFLAVVLSFLITFFVIEAAVIQRNPRLPTCEGNMPCRWALCSWELNPSSPNRCEVLEDDCICPSSTECKPTEFREHRSAMVSVQYRCLNSGRLFRP